MTVRIRESLYIEKLVLFRPKSIEPSLVNQYSSRLPRPYFCYILTTCLHNFSFPCLFKTCLHDFSFTVFTTIHSFVFIHLFSRAAQLGVRWPVQPVHSCLLHTSDVRGSLFLERCQHIRGFTLLLHFCVI